MVPNQFISSADAPHKDRSWQLLVILIGSCVGVLLVGIMGDHFGKDSEVSDWQPPNAESLMLPLEPMSHAPEEYTDSDPARSIVLADIRMVSARHKDDSIEERLVHVEHVERMTEAIINLHDLGANPHSGEMVEALDSISVSMPEFDGPYWWTTPSLNDSPDNLHSGAMVVRWNIERTWTPENGWTSANPPLQGW